MAYLNGAGYGDWKYRKADLARREARALHHIPWLRRVLGFDAVAVHGTSGIWLAPALVSHDIPVVLVRRHGETAHGNLVEAAGDRDVRSVLLLDDFVCSGATIARVIEILARPEYAMTLVGVLEHSCQPWRQEISEFSAPRAHRHGVPVYGATD